MQYRAEIDGLRALAVVPVILFHAGFSLFSGGFVGVDVFFVISGYLITSIILTEMDKDSFSLVNFYERRARRILPALFVVMAVTALCAWFWLVPRDMVSFAQSVVAVSTFSSNILFSGERGYFDSAVELKPLLHTWSLAVEEQYYIIFPVFLMLTWRFGKASILTMIALISIGSFALIYNGAFKPNAIFYLLPTRAWEILVGALAAFYFNHYRENNLSKGMNELISFSGLFFITFAVFAFDNETPFPSVYALVPVIGTLFIILCAQSGTFAARVLGSKVLVGIGLISYSAYLWHQPIFAFLKYRSVEHSSSLLIGALCLISFVLAYISWRFVEEPFRNKSKFTRKFIFTASLIGAVLFIAFGYLGTATNGYPDRFSKVQRQVIATALSSPMRKKCHDRATNYRAPSDACVYLTDNPSWAVFGDSHTVELAYALADRLKPADDGVQHFSFSNCPPSFGSKNGLACTKWTEAAIAHISESETLENIMVSYRMTTALHEDHEGHYPAMPGDLTADVQQAAWTSYVAVLRHFVAGGKRVYLVLQAPELPIDVQRMARFVPQTGEANVDGVSPQWWQQRSKYVVDRLDEIPAEVVVIDPAQLFCSKTSCRAISGGKSLYFDDDHMSLVGADMVVGRILSNHGSKQEADRGLE